MSKVEVVPHNPKWRDAFDAEANQVAAALGENVTAIRHIGSTSIPNIYAKPVIDMLVEVRNIDEVEGRNSAMELLGYEVMGEFGIPGRRYFRKDIEKGIRTHQIHAFETGSDGAVRHIAFRDYLIAHPEDAKEYSELKRKLADKHSQSMDDYMDGKDGFIKEIERRAGEWLSRARQLGQADCPFCDFSDREVLVYEDELVFAAISLRPINRHHVMVIPRKHYESFVELPDETASHIFLIAKRISAALRRVCQVDAICHISDDDVAGTGHNLVAHYKFHIIPRFKNDKIVMDWAREDVGLQERSVFAREIKDELIR